MNSYMFPIKVALITFPVLAFILTVPFLVHQYKKYRYINKFRAFVLYSFLLFLMVSYYLVILPLPNTHDVKSLQAIGTRHYNLRPFTFVHDFLKETHVVFNSPSSYIRILKERTFLQVAFNAILIAPLGIYLRYYFKKSLKQTVIICFLYSLFFELTQLTGVYGIYNAAYRLFDIDDLMLNTFGGFIGYIIAPVFTYFLPEVDKLDENINLGSMPVGYIRRFIAFQIDWFVIGIAVSILPISRNIIVDAVIVFLYFIVLVYFTNGKTFGSWLVKIKIQGEKQKITPLELVKRYGILYYGVFGFNYILSETFNANRYDSTYYVPVSIVLLIMLFVFNLVVFIHLLLHVFSKDKELFYEKMSKTKVVIIPK
ncbi:VanZ family protein [Clostridium tagluense]|uniref:VanZ family protein n=1 Tax=Clostridium tagluense TaxID=360422 RepID=UPI001C0DE106|nr:VanZ family protein [Clostridium tagluense]MBU3127945.1 VanZ family protein [Clostridium tagluense]